MDVVRVMERLLFRAIISLFTDIDSTLARAKDSSYQRSPTNRLRSQKLACNIDVADFPKSSGLFNSTHRIKDACETSQDIDLPEL